MDNTCILTKDKPPKEQLKALTTLVSRQEIIEFARAIDINWKPTDNSNINWMRASMAIQSQFGLFCNSWNEHIRLQYSTEISEEIAAATEDKSPEYLYHSGDFQPLELLTHSPEREFYEGNIFSFMNEDVQIAQILNENGCDEYLFSYKNKIVSLNKLEMNNLFLVEAFIKREFKKIATYTEVKYGNPVKFWQRNQYTTEQVLEKYYLDTVLTYKNDRYPFKFTKTKNGWRYLSLKGQLYWFTSEEMAYIVSNLKPVQKQFP